MAGEEKVNAKRMRESNVATVNVQICTNTHTQLDKFE